MFDRYRQNYHKTRQVSPTLDPPTWTTDNGVRWFCQSTYYPSIYRWENPNGMHGTTKPQWPILTLTCQEEMSSQLRRRMSPHRRQPNKSRSKEPLILRTTVEQLSSCVGWIIGEPVWVEQCPLYRDRLTILQMNKHKLHVSLQNNPVFVIKKKSGSQILQDLKAINKAMKIWGLPLKSFFFFLNF